MAQTQSQTQKLLAQIIRDLLIEKKNALFDIATSIYRVAEYLEEREELIRIAEEIEEVAAELWRLAYKVGAEK